MGCFGCLVGVGTGWVLGLCLGLCLGLGLGLGLGFGFVFGFWLWFWVGFGFGFGFSWAALEVLPGFATVQRGYVRPGQGAGQSDLVRPLQMVARVGSGKGRRE